MCKINQCLLNWKKRVVDVYILLLVRFVNSTETRFFTRAFIEAICWFWSGLGSRCYSSYSTCSRASELFLQSQEIVFKRRAMSLCFLQALVRAPASVHPARPFPRSLPPDPSNASNGSHTTRARCRFGPCTPWPLRSRVALFPTLAASPRPVLHSLGYGSPRALSLPGDPSRGSPTRAVGALRFSFPRLGRPGRFGGGLRRDLA